MIMVDMEDFKKFCFIILLFFCLFIPKVEAKEDLVQRAYIVEKTYLEVARLLEDYSSYKKLFVHMTTSKVLKEINQNKKIAYFEFKIFGRTFWAKVELEKIVLKNLVIIHGKTIDTNLKELNGSFTIERINEDRTRVIITGTIKPRMPLPESFLLKIITSELNTAAKRITHLLNQ